MEMITVKARNLSGVALDWAVAKATGQSVSEFEGNLFIRNECGDDELWSPSTNWAYGGKLIDQYGIAFSFLCDEWLAGYGDSSAGLKGESEFGPTHLISACRSIVATRLGPDVLVPSRLLRSE